MSTYPHVLTVREISLLVKNGEWQLPHFQRPYVWSKKKKAALFQSLIESFPISAVLIWKWNKKRGPSMPFDIPTVLRDLRKATHLVIDGQQRLTTLTRQFYLADLEIAIWNSIDGRSIEVVEIDLKQRDPAKQIALHVPRRLADRREYVSKDGKVLLPGLLSDDYQKKVIGKLKTKLLRRRASEIRTAIVDAQLLIDWLPEGSSIEKAVEAFERINSEGTRLGIVDIAAAQLFHLAPSLSDEVKKLIALLTSKGRYSVFTIDLLVRSMLFGLQGTANPAALRSVTRRQISRNDVLDSWTTTGRAFKELKDFIVGDLKMNDTASLQSAKLAVLVASQFFTRRDRSIRDRNRLKRWLVFAVLFKPYSGSSTNPSVDRDMSLMSKQEIDWRELEKTIKRNARGSSGIPLRISDRHLSPKDRVLPRAHILHHLAWISAHHHGAIDWISGAPIPALQPDAASPKWDRHHIFPVAHLRKKTLSPIANRLGNLAWIQHSSNRNIIKDRDPADYLRRILLADGGESALRTQAVPTNPQLYRDAKRFILARERQLAHDMNELMSLWGQGHSGRFEVQTRARRTVEEIVNGKHESHTIEFKSTFRLDLNTKELSAIVAHSLLKAVVSLANSGGGVVVIGVTDDGNVIGVEEEREALRKRSKSGRAELPILIKDFIGSETIPKSKDSLREPHLMSIEVEKISDKEVVVIRVNQAPQNVWMRKLPANTSSGARGPWIIFERDGASTKNVKESTLPDPTTDSAHR